MQGRSQQGCNTILYVKLVPLTAQAFGVIVGRVLVSSSKYIAEKEGYVLYPKSDRLLRVAEANEITAYNLPAAIAIPDDRRFLWQLAQHGFTTPDLLRDYSWPHRPRSHRPWTDSPEQRAVSSFLVSNNRGFVLSDPRTGKTISTLWAIDWLLSGVMKGQKAIVFAPKSTHFDVWMAEIEWHLPHLRAMVLNDKANKRYPELMREDIDIWIANYETITCGAWIEKNLKSRQNELMIRAKSPADALFNHRSDINIIVTDEATTFKRPSAIKSWIFKRYIFGKRYVWPLTGTPTAESPMDAHYLAKLFRVDYMEKTQVFKDKTMIRVSEFSWMRRPGAERYAAAVLSPNIRYSYGDVFDADLQDITLEKCLPGPETLSAVKRFMGEKVLELGAGKLTAVNEGVSQLKLLQMASGAVYTDQNEGRTVNMLSGAPNKLAALKRLILKRGKSLVFIPYTFVGDKIIVPYLKQLGMSFEYVTSDMSPQQRAEAFDRFRFEPAKVACIADPRLMAHGLDLSISQTCIWFGPCQKGETFQQANRRVVKPAAKTMVYCLWKTPLEKKAYKRLIDKRSFQGLVLEEIEALANGKTYEDLDND